MYEFHIFRDMSHFRHILLRAQKTFPRHVTFSSHFFARVAVARAVGPGRGRRWPAALARAVAWAVGVRWRRWPAGRVGVWGGLFGMFCGCGCGVFFGCVWVCGFTQVLQELFVLVGG